MEHDLRPLFERICAARVMPEDGRRKVARQVVDEQRQRVFNMMRYVAYELASKKSGKPTDAFLELFERLVASDVASKSGLSVLAESALGAAAAALSEEMVRRMDGLTFDDLTMLLGGGPGAAIVGEAMKNTILGEGIAVTEAP